jgi:putative polyketide hydroxylase
VIVKLLDRNTQQEELVHAHYIIAADGAHSQVRRQLAIEMDGPNNIGNFCNIYAEFDLSKWTRNRSSIGFFFTDPKISNYSLFSAYGKNRWVMGLRLSAENKKEEFTDKYCCEEIRRVLDLPNLKIKIINKNFWIMAAQVAKQYRQRRVFLVGDAAHRLPPTGGLGMNTGIQDVQNLAWKLAFVLNKCSSEALLDTYYEERAPIAKRNIQWSAENAQRYAAIAEAIASGDKEKLKEKLLEQQENLNYEGLDLGYIYHSKAVQSENEQMLSSSPSTYVSSTLPGIRAPHVQLLKAGKTISSLDLFEKEFVLLVGFEGCDWIPAAREFSEALPLKIYRIASDGEVADPGNTFLKRYEIKSTGAVLVRPDGHIFGEASP